MRIQGFNRFEIDAELAILWQYENATNLRTLVNNKQNWLRDNHQFFWIDWTQDIFNLATDAPNAFGMTVWSIILNTPVLIPVGEEPTAKPIWGFNEFDPVYPALENDNRNFGTTILLNPGSGNFSTKNQFYALTVEQQQFLLRLRYFQLTNLGDINDINTFLNHLCDTSNIDYNGTIYVIDNLDMTISYIYTDDFPPALFLAIRDLDVLPRPAGVAII